MPRFAANLTMMYQEHKFLDPRVFGPRHLVYMKKVKLVIQWVTGIEFSLRTCPASLYLSLVVDQIIQTFLQKFLSNYPQSLLAQCAFLLLFWQLV